MPLAREPLVSARPPSELGRSVSLGARLTCGSHVRNRERIFCLKVRMVDAGFWRGMGWGLLGSAVFWTLTVVVLAAFDIV